jgi:hypothetical protein
MTRWCFWRGGTADCGRDGIRVWMVVDGADGGDMRVVVCGGGS